MNFSHEVHHLQEKLERRGLDLLACKSKLLGKKFCTEEATNEDWKAIEAHLKGFGNSKQDLVAMKEVVQMTTIEKQCQDASIKAGVKDMASRIRKNPSVPKVPNHVIGHLFAPPTSDDDDRQVIDLAYWAKKYPCLDAETVRALGEMCEDYDRHPKCMMFPITAYFVSQSWSDEELQKWAKGTRGVAANWRGPFVPVAPGKMTTKKRGDLYAGLVYDVIDSMSGDADGVTYQDLEDSAELLKMLPLDELKKEVEQAGINVDRKNKKKNHKAALVVALVEYFYSDDIEPTASA